MGMYINPIDGKTKHRWLADNGKLLEHPPKKISDLPKEHLPVVLVDNGPFTAAGVAYCDDELQVFSDPIDPRKKLWYSVSIKDMMPHVSANDQQALRKMLA